MMKSPALKQVEKRLDAFLTIGIPEEHQSLVKSKLKYQARLIEVQMPEILWQILDDGMEAAKKADAEGCPPDLDTFLNNLIVGELFLGNGAGKMAIFTGALLEVVKGYIQEEKKI